MAITSRDFRELRLEHISRAFGSHNALRDVTLTVKRGEFIALLGPSGCGKSTALNCLAGLLSLSGGGIWLDDRRIDMLKPEDRGFGMVFQNYALFPHMTVRRNVSFGLQMQGVAKAKMDLKVEESLNVVRLAQQADKLPAQLSGGQQQRVAIARAIAVEPPLVLMDEPLSNLDAKLRLEMRGEIRRIHRLLGSATIYVTHDQDEALSLADRIVVLRDGGVRQIGTPHDLYNRPAHLDVAEFMGFRNALPARILRKQGDDVEMSLSGATLWGRGMDATDAGEVVAAIRPSDLVPMPEGAIGAIVTGMEYSGENFLGSGRTADGYEVFFRARDAMAPGATVRLGAPADRVLVYPRENVQ
ncbi:ABC transporter ATP-binding protein [Sodalis sp. RH16]|uniref:ABC transporter ATP-binding protein n=1 Tax=Sodalis sp. RH16 TaxID=3394331 RepID=UPI0039B6063F